MDFTTQKARFLADKILPKWVSEEVGGIIGQAQRSAAQLTCSQAELKSAQFLIEKLTLELLYLRRMRYGAKTEAWTADQKDMFEESVATDIAAIEAEQERKAAAAASEAAATPKPQRPRAGRQALPEHLPRVDIVHDLASCECAQCGNGLVKIGEDTTEKLTVKPAVFTVERHHYPKYACRRCETVFAEPVAPAVIDGGIASAALLAWVIVGKYVDHLPLYRIEQIGARHNVPLSRSNLAAWVGRVGVGLQPLVDRLIE